MYRQRACPDNRANREVGEKSPEFGNSIPMNFIFTLHERNITRFLLSESVEWISHASLILPGSQVPFHGDDTWGLYCCMLVWGKIDCIWNLICTHNLFINYIFIATKRHSLHNKLKQKHTSAGKSVSYLGAIGTVFWSLIKGSSLEKSCFSLKIINLFSRHSLQIRAWLLVKLFYFLALQYAAFFLIINHCAKVLWEPWNWKTHD